MPVTRSQDRKVTPACCYTPDSCPRIGRGGRIVDHCRFRTSFGGARFCQDRPYLEGFCKFHFKALQRGEINENGVINEKISDQTRRREINYHGILFDQRDYLDERT